MEVYTRCLVMTVWTVLHIDCGSQAAVPFWPTVSKHGEHIEDGQSNEHRYDERTAPDLWARNVRGKT